MRRLWIVILLLALPGAALAQSGGPTLIREAKSPHAVKDQYIVVLNHGVDLPAAANDMARSYRGQVLHVYGRALHGFALRLPAP
ncbi:MAG TPA: S8 family peptidase, partial [Thermoanaerobaculia bacterium]|nr:S8 family peptidase [Thermoanaerobaculia bacterium]